MGVQFLEYQNPRVFKPTDLGHLPNLTGAELWSPLDGFLRPTEATCKPQYSITGKKLEPIFRKKTEGDFLSL